MRYLARLSGISPLLQNNRGAALDTRSPESREISEISRTKASQRTEADENRLRDLQVLRSIHRNPAGAAYLPSAMMRAAIEFAARKLKQGAGCP